MAVLRIPDEKKTLRDEGEIRDYLAGIGIDYERWEMTDRAGADASADEILNEYAPEIEKLKARGGYVTADVIDVKPDTIGLDAMPRGLFLVRADAVEAAGRRGAGAGRGLAGACPR